MQMAASGLGTAIIPSILGILARHFSLEIIPICMMVMFLLLLGLYQIATGKIKKEDAL